MKKHYFLFLAMLLVQLVGVNVFAQSSLTVGLGDPLIWDESQIYSNASDRDEGQNIGALIDGNSGSFWHSDWHGDVSEPHYLQFEFEEPVEGKLVVYYQCRNIDSNHIKRMAVTVSHDAEEWVDLGEIAFDSPAAQKEFVTDPIILEEPYEFVRFTIQGQTFFHAAEFQLYNPSDVELIIGAYEQVLEKYQHYYDDIIIGTAFGNYTDTENFEKFQNAIDELSDLIVALESGEYEGPLPKDSDVEEAEAEISALIDKVLASEVLFKLPHDGYYRVQASVPFRYNEVVGTDENGLDITETKYTTKAMYCDLSGAGMWGTPMEDRANFIWKLTQEGDSIDMVNAGMDMRFSVFGGNVKLSAESTRRVIMDFAGVNDEGQDVVYIRAANGERNAEEYLHMYGHSRLTDQHVDKNLCIWKGTFNMGAPYESDKGTSEWVLVPVSDEEAAELIEAFGPIKNHDLLVEQNNALRAEVKEALLIAKDPIITSLITSGEQMTSPYSQNDWGNRDGGDLEAGVLIDNNPDSFWHSVWSTTVDGTHYILLSDMEDFVEDVKLYLLRRKTDSNHPSEFTFYGSNDPDAEDEEWVKLAVLPLENASSGKEFTSEVFNVGSTPYSYIRVAATKNASGAAFWHAAELQLYSVRENPNSQFAALGEIATALEDIYNENAAIDDADVTIEMYNALLAAYKAFNAGLVDPTELRNALAAYANAAKSVVEGENPGEWSTFDMKDAFEAFYGKVAAYNEAGIYNETLNHKYALQLKAMAETLISSANGINTTNWFRIKFPSYEMYEDNKWNVSNVEGSNMGTDLYDTYVTVGQAWKEDGSTYDVTDIETEEIREGQPMFFLEEDLIENESNSLFRFVPVESDYLFGANYDALLNNAIFANEIATEYGKGENLITDYKQFSSNSSDSSEGLFMEYLIDGKPNTIWHSDYHKKDIPGHYLQVALNEPVSDPIQIVMTRRSGIDYGHAEIMYVKASKDGEAWDNIGLINLPYKAAGETVVSAPIALNDTYSYLRFVLVKRAGLATNFATDKAYSDEYFHVAEFQVRTAPVVNVSQPELAAAVAEARKVEKKDVTADMYPALCEAYNKAVASYNEAEDGNFLAPATTAPTQGYALQNKTNGLFVHCAQANNTEVTLELIPTIYTFSALGYGECLLHGIKVDGTDCTNLHAQRVDHKLVTWNANNASSNSGLMLVQDAEVEDANEFTFYKGIVEGYIHTWAAAVSVTNNGDGAAYAVEGVYTVEEEGTYLALKEVETVPAGNPALYIYGDTDNYVEENEAQPMQFTLTTDINLTPATVNGLQACYVPTPMPADVLYFPGNHAECIEEAGYNLRYGRAMLHLGECPEVSAEGDYDLSILITEAADAADGIKDVQTAVSQVSKAGAIYTMDGKLVRQNGTLRDVKALGRGMYILNGVKVVVK